MILCLVRPGKGRVIVETFSQSGQMFDESSSKFLSYILSLENISKMFVLYILSHENIPPYSQSFKNSAVP